jgi:1D-myo-inositol-tetrakisphosphate 5-kinase/inositol-polyphosphate multikinase
MGARSWDDAASAEKRAREDAKWPAQARLGLRFTGMAICSSGGGGTTLLGGAFCRGLPCEADAGPRLALETFLADRSSGGVRLGVAAAFLARLEEMLAWFTVQCEFRFYASSLLFVYEGGGSQGGATAGAGAGGPAALADVRMIDFAHVQALQEGPGARDEGYILGLRTLVRCLQGMLTAGSSSSSSSGSGGTPSSASAPA